MTGQAPRKMPPEVYLSARGRLSWGSKKRREAKFAGVGHAEPSAKPAGAEGKEASCAAVGA